MTIVLLGASGQLGREWEQTLAQSHQNDTVFCYNSDQLDITHYQEVSDELRDKNPDWVINCAAYTNVDEAEDHRKLARKVNHEAVLYLAELSNELRFTLIHYSTDYVFPGRKENRREFPDGYPEDYPADPINWYGKTKWQGEQAIRQTTENHLIIRLAWLCGQFGSNFVKTMLALGRERDQLQVVNDQWGSPTFVENVVSNSLHLLDSDQRGTFHITSNGLITWYDFAQSIFTFTDINVDLEPVSSEAFPTKARRPHFSKLSTQKIESIPGSSIIDWKEGTKQLLKQIED